MECVDPAIVMAWATVILAVFTIALVLVTAFFMRRQDQRALQIHGLDTLTRLRDLFHSDTYVEARKGAANRLLKHDLSSEGISYSDHFNRIATHFERIEFYIEKGVLDGEMVWFTFGIYVRHWYPCLKDYIEQRRAANPSTLEHVGHLHQRIIELEKKKWKAARKDYSGPSADDLRHFLVREAQDQDSASDPPPAVNW
jgi:hypothetical protein